MYVNVILGRAKWRGTPKNVIIRVKNIVISRD